GRGAEAVYREGRMTASYVHFYFPSNPAAVAALFAPDLEAAIAGKPAPTVDGVMPEEMQSPVGAGLPAMGP
ncbi:cobyrinate a,c-diamide synthase, partial [Pseudomonas syringae]|nr:cobyrinate a,c-diamide synthase [Pseudomonas syringae]